MKKISSLKELKYPLGNLTIPDSYTKCKSMLDNKKYQRIMVSVSGGADSDIIVDMVSKLDINNKCTYVFFDTGMEYNATKEQIKYLQDKYGIEIYYIKPKVNIVIACRDYGQPFLSKYVSGAIKMLQDLDFKWEDKSLIELCEEYLWEVTKEVKKGTFDLEKYQNGRHIVLDGRTFIGKGIGVLKWWTDEYRGVYSISDSHRFLKDFIMENPPWFRISDDCCKYIKKDTSLKIAHECGFDLMITGIRKAEGGARSVAYKSCVVQARKNMRYDLYMPIFWYTKDDREIYESFYDISHSRCYTEYGYTRTGCVACPFGGAKGINSELKVLKDKEPNLYKAAKNIFADSYKYTKMYYDYVKERKKKEKMDKKAKKFLEFKEKYGK